LRPNPVKKASPCVYDLCVSSCKALIIRTRNLKVGMSQGSTARNGPMHTTVAQYAEKDASGQPTDVIRTTAIAQLLEDADQQSYGDERAARKREAERKQEVEELSRRLNSRNGTVSASGLAELLSSRDCPVAPTTRSSILRQGTQMRPTMSQRSNPPPPPSSPNDSQLRSRATNNGDPHHGAGDTEVPTRTGPSVRFPNSPEVQEYTQQSIGTMQHGKTAPAHLVDTQEEMRRAEARAAAGYPASPDGRAASQRSAASRLPSSPQTQDNRGTPSTYAAATDMQQKADGTARRDDVHSSRYTATAGDRPSQPGRNTTPTRRTAVPESRDEHGASQRQVTPTRASAPGAEPRSTTPGRASGRAGETLGIPSPGGERASPYTSTAPARASERISAPGAAEVSPHRSTATPTRASERLGAPGGEQASPHRSTTPVRASERLGAPGGELASPQRSTTPVRASERLGTSAGEQASPHRSTTPVRISERAGEALGTPGPDRASGKPGEPGPSGRSTMRQTMNTQLAYEEFQRQQRDKAEQEEFEAAHRREVARLKRQQELHFEFEQEKRKMEEDAKRRMEEKQAEHQKELQRVEDEARKRDEDRKMEREKKDLAHFEAEQHKRRADRKKAEEEKRKRCEAAQKLIDEAVGLYQRQKQALLELRTISEECAKLLPQMEEVDLKAKGGKVLYHSFLRLRDATKPAESVTRVDEEIDHLNQLRNCEDF